MKPITCDEALELISARLDGALSPDGEAALEAHLARCPACGALLADLTEIHAALDGAEEVPPPADLKDKIMAAVAAEQVVPLPAAPARRRPSWRAWGSIAAVLALALLGGGLLHNLGNAGGTNAAPMAAGGAAPRGVYSAQAPAGSPAPAAEDGLLAPEAASQAVDPAEAQPADLEKNLPGQEADAGEPQSTPAPAPFRIAPASGGALTADTLPEAVCGILTLPAGDAPALDAYFSAQAEDGLHYYLPAADFQALAGSYDGGAALDDSGDGIDPEAEYGLVILTP